MKGLIILSQTGWCLNSVRLYSGSLDCVRPNLLDNMGVNLIRYVFLAIYFHVFLPVFDRQFSSQLMGLFLNHLYF